MIERYKDSSWSVPVVIKAQLSQIIRLRALMAISDINSNVVVNMDEYIQPSVSCSQYQGTFSE